VVDASAEELEQREAAVVSVLEEIGAGDRPRLQVLNKSDRVPWPGAARWRSAPRCAARVGAHGEGLAELKAALASRLDLVPRRVRLRFAKGDARGVAGVYGAGRVTRTRSTESAC